MSLAERLESVRRNQQPPARARTASARQPRSGPRRGPVRRRQGECTPGAARLSSARSSTTRTCCQSELETQGAAHAPGGHRRRADPAVARGPHADLPGGLRRDPRPRPARAFAAGPRDHRDHGQRPRQHLRRARGQALPVSTPASSPTPTCAAPSTRSSAASVGASTRRARWSTPACPTAPASTP